MKYSWAIFFVLYKTRCDTDTQRPIVRVATLGYIVYRVDASLFFILLALIFTFSLNVLKESKKFSCIFISENYKVTAD